MKILLVFCFYTALLCSRGAIAQEMSADTVLARAFNLRAKYLIENRQFDKSDSILFYSQEAASIYLQLKNWNGLLTSLSYQMEVNARKTLRDETFILFDSIVSVSKKNLGGKNAFLATAHHFLGMYYSKVSESDSALANILKSLELRKELLGEKHLDVASSYYSLGSLYDDMALYNKSLEYYFKCLAIRKELIGEKHIDVAATYNNIGIVYKNESEYDSALVYYHKSLIIRKLLLGEMHPEIVSLYQNIGRAYEAKPDFEKALGYYIKSLEISRILYGESHFSVATAYNALGSIYYKISEFDKALEYFTKSMEIRKEIYGEKDERIAIAYQNIGVVYEVMEDFSKALEYQFKSLEINKEIYGENHAYIAENYNNIANVYERKGEYIMALDYNFRSLKIRLEVLGEKNVDTGFSYQNIGNVYFDLSEYDKALEYYFKGLELFKLLLGENHPYVPGLYNNIANTYYEKTEYDKAIEISFKGLKLFEETSGEKSIEVANTYESIGNLFYKKAEYNKSLGFFIKSLMIRKEILGEKHTYVASSTDNIGNIYEIIGEYDKSLEYHLRSLNIRKEVFGENHRDVAKSYNNIGNVYLSMHENEKALDCFFKSVEICKALFGDKHINIASTFENIGTTYSITNEHNNAKEYFLKSLQIQKEINGEKNVYVADAYNTLGDLYVDLEQSENALSCYHKGLVANLRNYSDSLSLLNLPFINNYLDYNELLRSLKGKATVLAKEAQTMPIALNHYQAADTLIRQVRQTIAQPNDKIELSANATSAYVAATNLCLKLSTLNPSEKGFDYLNQAFYFSEQSKGMVLLEALAGSEGIRHTEIPDSLIEQEHNLKVNISIYEKKLAEGTDSSTNARFQAKLFEANRQYEELTANLEKSYPKYYELKYSLKHPSVQEIQKNLDKKTAIRSYSLSDSSLFIFTVTKENLNVQQVMGTNGLDHSVQVYRSALTGDPRFFNHYLSSGTYLYSKLFPDNIADSKNIENLVIIPDGCLAFIPFESLPMAENTYTTVETSLTVDSLRGFKSLSTSINSQNMKDYPFLIKRFSISYAYSATLYYQNCLAETKKNSKRNKLSWLAVAPVFSDNDKKLGTNETIELQRQMKVYRSDTLSTRGMLLNGEYVIPLPGTEAETASIQKEFSQKKLKAKVLLKDEANEKNLKSGILEDFSILHFATHGFVNSEKPELSGLLLAQDSTGGNDGILFSGELYNLKLNADLTVLSACETGLGKVRKGEGIIGLTRALLYAGSKNIVVSLWPVSDNSTSELMIDFYGNLLNAKKNQSYSQWLRSAKLKMIEEGKYSHPFYWSPFILVGK